MKIIDAVMCALAVGLSLFVLYVFSLDPREAHRPNEKGMHPKIILPR